MAVVGRGRAWGRSWGSIPPARLQNPFKTPPTLASHCLCQELQPPSDMHSRCPGTLSPPETSAHETRGSTNGFRKLSPSKHSAAALTVCCKGTNPPRTNNSANKIKKANWRLHQPQLMKTDPQENVIQLSSNLT